MAAEKSPQTKPGKGLFARPADSFRLLGDIDAAREAGLEVINYQLKQQMQARGLEWTRENFINYHWRGELPDWWDENEIPEALRDWDTGPPI